VPSLVDCLVPSDFDLKLSLVQPCSAVKCISENNYDVTRNNSKIANSASFTCRAAIVERIEVSVLICEDVTYRRLVMCV